MLEVRVPSDTYMTYPKLIYPWFCIFNVFVVLWARFINIWAIINP